MGRPFYETPQNVSAEAAIAKMAERAWSGPEPVRMIKLRAGYPADYIAQSAGQMKALVEIKKRNVEYGAYPTLHISAKKIGDCLQLANVMKVTPILLVAYNDKLVWANMNDVSDCRIQIGGRTDRGDPHDIEPVFDVPLERFWQVRQR